MKFKIEKSIKVNLEGDKINQCFEEDCCEFYIHYNLILPTTLDEKGFSLDTSLLRQWVNNLKLDSCENILLQLEEELLHYIVRNNKSFIFSKGSTISISPVNISNGEYHKITLELFD